MKGKSMAESNAQIQDLFGVAGKVVLVTGGSRGIGYGIAEGFAKAGAKVYICSRKEADCKQAAKDLSEFGQVEAITANLSNIEGTQELANEIASREERLDVVVNNAGALWAAGLEEYPESGWDKTYDLNVKGTFFLIQALLPLLKKSATKESPGRIVNIGSIDAYHVPKHETYAYSSSKAAVHMLSKHLAWKLAPEHITVNVIAPGLYLSKMLQGTLETKGEEALLEPVPLKRLAAPSDLAGAAIFLSSKASSFVTGEVLSVDGGYATTL
jgi:NAD(P)-dependent dehydrogenase (short-subunit alcohol dehydrogenase family)